MSREETVQTIPQPLLLIEQIARQNLQEQFGKLPTNILNGLGSKDLLAEANKIGLMGGDNHKTLLSNAEGLLDKAQQNLFLSTKASALLLNARESLKEIKVTGANILSLTSNKQKVQDAFRLIAEETATQERHMYTSIAEGALQRLGYQTIREDGKTASAIQATKGHEVRVIGIDKDLNLMRDGAGLTGDACKKADELIVKELEKGGIALAKVRKSRKHGQSKGGDMLREAGKEHKANLAAGWVNAKDGSGKSGPKTTHKVANKNANKMKEAN